MCASAHGRRPAWRQHLFRSSCHRPVTCRNQFQTASLVSVAPNLKNARRSVLINFFFPKSRQDLLCQILFGELALTVCFAIRSCRAPSSGAVTSITVWVVVDLRNRCARLGGDRYFIRRGLGRVKSGPLVTISANLPPSKAGVSFRASILELKR